MDRATKRIRTDSPAPSAELIEQEKREQLQALSRICRMLDATERAARLRKARGGDDLTWARGIHQPAKTMD
jgi:hypothetical protein